MSMDKGPMADNKPNTKMTVKDCRFVNVMLQYYAISTSGRDIVPCRRIIIKLNRAKPIANPNLSYFFFADTRLGEGLGLNVK